MSVPDPARSAPTLLSNNAFQRIDTSKASKYAWIRDNTHTLLILCMGIGNIFTDINLEPLTFLTFTALGVIFLTISAYLDFRADEILTEGTFFVGIWFLLTAFGIKTTYLAASAGFPLQDSALQACDHFLRFDWKSWALFIDGFPTVQKVQELAYSSYAWQIIFTIAVLAFWRIKGRNRELVTSLTIALLITIVVFTFIPVLGPADLYKIPTALADVIRDIRAQSANPLPAIGIIGFPSYHTAMAILFTLAHRNLWTFWPILILNCIMLTSVPYAGDHYLTDMPAGAAVAIGSFIITRYIANDSLDRQKIVALIAQEHRDPQAIA